MTVDEFMELLDPSGGDYDPDAWEKVYEVLPSILKKAAGFYDDHDNDFICDDALCIAMYAVGAGGGLPKTDLVVEHMALLANALVLEHECREIELPPATRERLEQIKKACPELFGEPAAA